MPGDGRRPRGAAKDNCGECVHFPKCLNALAAEAEKEINRAPKCRVVEKENPVYGLREKNGKIELVILNQNQNIDKKKIARKENSGKAAGKKSKK